MEASRSFHHGYSQLLLHDLLGRVIGKLQVVDASHDAWKVVVGSQRRFMGLPDDGERWIKATETYKVRSDALQFDRRVTYHQSAVWDYR